MFIELIIAMSMGVFLGFITGVIPGLHINLISTLVIANVIFLKSNFDPLYTSVAIVVMSLVNNFVDFIPSCYLGAPNEETILTVLPGHRYLKQGKAHEAILLAVIGSSLGVILIAFLSIPLLAIVKGIYEKIKSSLGIILIIVVIILLVKERKSKFFAFLVFLLSGILGLIVLNMPTLKEPLLPLLAGLFGIPNMLMSLQNKEKIPKQVITFPEINKITVVKAGLSSLISGTLFSILPALGPSQAAILGSEITKLKNKGFMILSGSINAINMMFGLVTFFAIGKPRNGPIVAVSKLIANTDIKVFLFLIVVAIVALPVAILVTLYTSRMFVGLMNKLNYKIMNITILIFLIIITIILSKWLGLLVLIIAASIGLVCHGADIQKSHLMGVLMVPVIGFFMV